MVKVSVDWNRYRQMLDEKESDAKYNLEQAEKKVKTARAAYEAILRERKAFEHVLIESMGE
jgi:pheromone shutdown protein TraB